MAEFVFREKVPRHGAKRGPSAAHWNLPKDERRRLARQFENDLKDSMFLDLVPEDREDE